MLLLNSVSSVPAYSSNTRWACTDKNSGLCQPSNSPAAPFSRLDECQTFCRPENRPLTWNVTNSGDSTCRSTVNGSGLFTDGLQCASSPLANFRWQPQPDKPKGFICSHPQLNQCMETDMTHVPFSYKVYATYQDCKNAPECSDGVNWYIDATQNQCLPSTLPSAPFTTRDECQSRLVQANYAGLPTVQFSNPLRAADYAWTEPFKGYMDTRKNGHDMERFLETPEIALNKPGEPPQVQARIAKVPGLAGSGYSLLG